MIPRPPDDPGIQLPLETLLRAIVIGPPAWYPYGAELDTEYQIPRLPLVRGDDLPAEMWAFDKIASASDASRTLADFYVEERKLRRLIDRPQRFASQFEGLWGVTSPDFSMWAESPPQFRQLATWLNRSIGRVYSDRGIRVVPHLRWSDSRDHDHCFAGVERGSVVAVSTHGAWRQVDLRHQFLMGLRPMVEAITPPVVIVHGSIDPQVRREIGPSVQILHFEPDRTRLKRAV